MEAYKIQARIFLERYLWRRIKFKQGFPEDAFSVDLHFSGII